jgi:hypothetical protein
LAGNERSRIGKWRRSRRFYLRSPRRPYKRPPAPPREVSQPAYFAYGLGDEVRLTVEIMPVRVS